MCMEQEFIGQNFIVKSNDFSDELIRCSKCLDEIHLEKILKNSNFSNNIWFYDVKIHSYDFIMLWDTAKCVMRVIQLKIILM